MAGPLDNYERWSCSVTMLAADASKTALAAKAGRTTVCTHYRARILVSAAQAVDIKIGTTVLCSFAASEVVGTESFMGPMDFGLVGQLATALTINPAAAGPSIQLVAEGYYR